MGDHLTSDMEMWGPMWMPEAPPTFLRLIAWHWQPVPLYPVLFALLMGLYAAAVWKLHREGVRWPVHRTVLWMLGGLVMIWATGSALEGYGMLLFSAHMFQHMTLSMLAPVLLLLGAPVTLVLRVLPAGRGWAGSVRRELLRFLHSRFVRVISHPVFTWPLFIGSLYGLYFTPLFDRLMSTLPGHLFMLGHFFVSGYLFFGPVLAVDPWPRRAGHGARMVELFLGTPIHAFFGVIVMMAPSPLVDFFVPPPEGWGIDPMTDQGVGGGIAWFFGEIPTLCMIIYLGNQWYKSEERAARRHERQAQRDGDAQLRAYNDWLRSLATPAERARREVSGGR